MDKIVVQGERVRRECGEPIGPYSHGVVARGGRLLFIAGQVAWDAEGKIVGKGDLAAQYRKVMENIKAVVEDAGGTMDNICKIVNYVTKEVTREKNYHHITETRKQYIKGNFPVSTLVQVESLMDPDAWVEVDAIALLD